MAPIFVEDDAFFNLGEEATRGQGTAATPRMTVRAVSRDEFREICGIVTDAAHPVFDEQGWFADETESFLSPRNPRQSGRRLGLCRPRARQAVRVSGD